MSLSSRRRAGNVLTKLFNYYDQKKVSIPFISPASRERRIRCNIASGLYERFNPFHLAGEQGTIWIVRPEEGHGREFQSLSSRRRAGNNKIGVGESIYYLVSIPFISPASREQNEKKSSLLRLWPRFNPFHLAGEQGTGIFQL